MVNVTVVMSEPRDMELFLKCKIKVEHYASQAINNLIKSFLEKIIMEQSTVLNI